MPNKNDSLGDRMKGYESVSKTSLVKRMPVAVRIDVRAFHTFTMGFNKPYDAVLSNSMMRTMQCLCENVQGCVLGYTQSDEITLVLVDYQTVNTNAFFDNEVQKICSITASMATSAFSKFFVEEAQRFMYNTNMARAMLLHGDKLAGRTGYTMDEYKEEYGLDEEWLSDVKNIEKLFDAYTRRFESMIMFDSRCFNIPKEEVANLILWRQQDATRNSIEMLGRHYFSQKQLHKKNCSQIQDMLMEEHGVNWNDVKTVFKRGSCCIKKDVELSETLTRRKWTVDTEIPVFTGDGRDYIEKLVFV